LRSSNINICIHFLSLGFYCWRLRKLWLSWFSRIKWKFSIVLADIAVAIFRVEIHTCTPWRW
jgi:hypothetical protein